MTDRPSGVPADYVLVDCDNPACDYTVWVPFAELEVDGTPVMRVCSAVCAMAVMRLFPRRPSE